MAEPRLGRVLTAMITPFTESGAVDIVGAATLARHLVATGSDGVVVCGTTGESPTLSDAEKVTLFQTVREAVGRDALVIAGTGSNNTAASVALTQKAQAIGVDGIMAVVPYYNKPNQEGLFRHFKAIAEATNLPVMLYNVPGRTAGNLLPETVARLAQIKNIVAIKEASANLEQVTQICALHTLSVYSGDDSLTLPIMAVGGVGVVSVAAHVAGNAIKSMIGAFLAGRVREAAEQHQRLLPLFKVLFVTTNPIPVKAACRMLGLPSGPLRLPLVDPTDAERQTIETCLRQYGILAVQSRA